MPSTHSDSYDDPSEALAMRCQIAQAKTLGALLPLFLDKGDERWRLIRKLRLHKISLAWNPRFRRRGGDVGICDDGDIAHIRINPRVLLLDEWGAALYEIVLHEMAHVVGYLRTGKWGHDAAWATACRELGLPPRRLHSWPLGSRLQNGWVVQARCGRCKVDVWTLAARHLEAEALAADPPSCVCGRQLRARVTK